MRDPEAPTVDDVPSTPEEENALVSLRAALSEEAAATDEMRRDQMRREI